MIKIGIDNFSLLWISVAKDCINFISHFAKHILTSFISTVHLFMLLFYYLFISFLSIFLDFLEFFSRMLILKLEIIVFNFSLFYHQWFWGQISLKYYFSEFYKFWYVTYLSLYNLKYFLIFWIFWLIFNLEIYF